MQKSSEEEAEGRNMEGVQGQREEVKRDGGRKSDGGDSEMKDGAHKKVTKRKRRNGNERSNGRTAWVRRTGMDGKKISKEGE